MIASTVKPSASTESGAMPLVVCAHAGEASIVKATRARFIADS
jgi:hypothetical protein